MRADASGAHPAEVETHSVSREFLYADLDRARSLIAQLLGSVPEEERGTTGTTKRFSLGAENYVGLNKERRSEEYRQRSLLDALFPELDGILKRRAGSRK